MANSASTAASAARFRFGLASEVQLATVHPDLVKVCRRALSYGVLDFTVVEGHRGKAAQEAAVAKGASQLHFPFGNHNATPSRAVDLAPYAADGVEWSDRPVNVERWCVLAGLMLAAAAELGVPIRWGGDWDQDGDTRDEHFRDRPHFELR